MVYSDTDSLCFYVTLKVKGWTLDDLLSKTFFRLYLDRSNFKVLDKRLDEYEPGSFGLYKSELSDSIVEECVFISPKCYSIKSYPRKKPDSESDSPASSSPEYKRALKGVPRKIVKNAIPHRVFKDLLFDEFSQNPTQVSFNKFRFNP